ncbi:MAG: hypothetical protein M3Q14_01005 [bacterium]|nr:hypothetical protein [bacterium]
MFAKIDVRICADAWAMIFPAIRQKFTNDVIDKLRGAIIVLDPRPPEEDHANEKYPVLYQATIVSSATDEKYVRIATSMALASLKTGLPSCRIQQEYPNLYEEGDTKWGGSTVDPDGLIVAFSGVQAVFSEMIAQWMASAIRAQYRYWINDLNGS